LSSALFYIPSKQTNIPLRFLLKHFQPAGGYDVKRLSQPRTKIDLPAQCPNNRAMAQPPAPHRMKSYTSETGYVYQYYFYAAQQTRRGSSSGREYVYMVSADRKSMFPLKVFVRRDAVEQWSRSAGRELTGTEEYAAAKMRLFAGFDELHDLATARPELLVDETNLTALLAKLDI
jgi:hypothetical protein